MNFEAMKQSNLSNASAAELTLVSGLNPSSGLNPAPTPRTSVEPERKLPLWLLIAAGAVVVLGVVVWFFFFNHVSREEAIKRHNAYVEKNGDDGFPLIRDVADGCMDFEVYYRLEQPTFLADESYHNANGDFRFFSEELIFAPDGCYLELTMQDDKGKSYIVEKKMTKDELESATKACAFTGMSKSNNMVMNADGSDFIFTSEEKSEVVDLTKDLVSNTKRFIDEKDMGYEYEDLFR